MSNVQDSRNEFLLGISLSEISFIFFMLLVLISLHSVNQHKKELETTTRELAETKKELRVTQEALRDTTNLFTENKEALEKSETELKKVKKERNFYKEAAEIQAKIIQEDKKHIKELLSNLGLSKSEIEDFQTKLVNVRKLKQEIYVLKKENDQIKKDRKEYKLTDLKFNEIFKQFSEIRNELKSAGLDGAQVSRMIKKYDKSKGKGFDVPPCFIRTTINVNKKSVEKADYMYNIDVHESHFVIKQAWKEKFRERMVNMGAIFSGRITFNNFADLGNKILSDAKKHKCRHFVRVYDKTGDSKKIWKTNTKMLKNYFITWPP